MSKFALFSMLLLLAAPSVAHASDDDHQCPNDDCKPKTKEVCFNMLCTFHDKDAPEGFEKCEVASTFTKRVTLDGGEVTDDSEYPYNPRFEVKCGSQFRYKNSAHRYTNLLGTRFQAEEGPYPSVTIPRGALHSGAEGSAGEHIAKGEFELDEGDKVIRERGSCFIWTGAP